MTDTLFVNAIVHPLDDVLSTAEAMLVRAGRVVATGTRAELERKNPQAERVDLGGRHVFPGFIDAHAHLFGLGQEALIVPLHGVHSAGAAAALVRARTAATPEGAWIQGRGWDQNLWPGMTFPTAADLDAATTRHPVYLRRIDGHAAWCNSNALARAGITRETKDPPGGRIVRDDAGNPTGVLIDNAADLVRAVIPEPSPAEYEVAYRHAVASCLSTGMTGMHDMGLAAPGIAALRALIGRGEFPFRVTGYIDGTGKDWEALLTSGATTDGDDRLQMAGLKLYADGALGSRGAFLFDPYTDDAANRGLRLTDVDTIAHEAVRAAARGLQVCVHAIGDAGNDLALTAFERATDALRKGGTRTLNAGDVTGAADAVPVRFRIEHVQVLRSADATRFAAAGIVPSMQPVHCTSDMRWAEQRLGPDRIRTAYAWRTLLDAGAWIPGGSDFPIERPDPLAGILAACTRRDAAGRPATQRDIDSLFSLSPASRPTPDRCIHGWYGDQRMTRREAVFAFTRWAARAANMEDRVGSLRAGTWADFIVLSGDLLTVSDRDLPTLRVLETWSAGRKVWDATEQK